MRVGWVFSAIFEQCRHISKTVHFRHKVTGTVIGNHMQAIEWCQFRWPWMTRPGFQGHGSFTRPVSPKRRILQTQLLDVIGHHRHAIDRQQLYRLQTHCSYVNRAHFSQVSRGFVSDSWAFLFDHYGLVSLLESGLTSYLSWSNYIHKRFDRQHF